MTETKQSQNDVQKSDEIQAEVDTGLLELLTPAGTLKASDRMRFMSRIGALEYLVGDDGEISFSAEDLSVMEKIADLVDFIADRFTVSDEAKRTFEQLEITAALQTAFAYMEQVGKHLGSAES